MGPAAILDRRLLRDIRRPLAVALSGGGDSVALTLIADDWARQAGRDLLILTVDHGLRPESRAWTDACAALAARLGRPFRALGWTGDKPTTGLPAAARAARHRLLADAAREADASVILMGHTADDLAESRAMRAAGSTTPDAREWAPSPAWPEGRGVFLLRPLLTVRRAELRGLLTARGEPWIEDPANADPRFARARARAAAPPVGDAAPDAPLELARRVKDDDSALVLARADLRTAPSEARRRLVAIASVCAGGAARRPAGPPIERLAARLASDEVFIATLAGARIEALADTVRFAREPGEAARGGLPTLALPQGRAFVWDGRYAVTSDRPGLSIRPGRRGEPVILDAEGEPAADIIPRPLVAARFRAATGLIDREPAD